MEPRMKTADVLAVAAVVLAAIAAAAGLLVGGVYRDTAGMVRQAAAADLVTLLLAVPALALSLWWARSGSAVGRMIAIGALGYLSYSYAIYAFSVVINPLTPIHIAILGLATWALVLSVFGIDDLTVDHTASYRLPRRTTGAFLFLVAALFAAAWLGQIAGAISSGTLPVAISDLGLPTNAVYALDLAFALPVFVVAGLWLVRRDPRGSAAALAVLGFSVLMGASVVAIFAVDAAARDRHRAGPGGDLRGRDGGRRHPAGHQPSGQRIGDRGQSAAVCHPMTRTAAAGRSRTSDLRAGGALLFIAGTLILMGIITAEALYPGTYSTHANEISDLGATRPPNSIIYQPSATIFDVSMMAIGLMVLAATWFVHRAFARRSVSIPLAVLGLGALGVGLFPGNTGTPHALFAMATFVSGGIAGITAARVTTAPFRLISGTLGAVSLATLVGYLVAGDSSPMAELGIGGIERWIVYPIVLWVTAFGGYLSGRADVERASG